MATQPGSSFGAYLGPGLVLVFCVSQGLRDVYFGHVFQGVDFFVVILLAFLLSTVIFTVIALLRTPGAFGTLRGQFRTVLAMNVATALAWSCYFFALTHLEPSVVNTLHSGMGPLTVIVLGAFGVRMAKSGTKSGTIGWCAYFGYTGMALSLAGLWWVVLADGSGVQGADPAQNLLGLALLLVSGSSITVSLLYCKSLHDRGVSAEVVTSVRYIALMLVAGIAVARHGRSAGVESLGEVATLSVLATTLIVLPLYALQLGTAMTAPLAAHVLRSLGPVFVFGFQQLDGRLSYSVPTLVCILAYSAAAIASNLAQVWRPVSSGRSPAPRLRAEERG